MKARLIVAGLFLALAACNQSGRPAPIGPNQAAINQQMGQVVDGAYVVAPGDTLAVVSERTNTPIRTLIDLNNLVPPYVIAAGQRLALQQRSHYVVRSGDTEFLPGAVVDKHRFKVENGRVMEKGGKPSEAKPLLLGITKAALQSESFISAASFQETTKVLTEAALAAKRDELVGLKENVILGHMVPAGTGFKKHLLMRVQKPLELLSPPPAGSETVA